MFRIAASIVTTTVAILVTATPCAASSLVPPIDPLCGGCDHSHQDHSGHEHDHESLIAINLFGACLSYADFSGSNLTNAFMKGTDGRYANFSEAHLQYAQIAGSNFAGANLSLAQLSGADLIFTNLTGANLRYANLAGANLMGATLVDADLRNTNWTGANIVGADFSGADLGLAKFLENAQSDGSTKYDVATDFSGTGFDPIAAGWSLSRAACCVNGNCAVTDQATCLALGGTYDATAAVCALVVCAPGCVPIADATGGCCLNGMCIVAGADECVEAGGTFNGAEADCIVNACTAPCPFDLDGDGGIGFADILEIVTNWGPCPG